MIAALESKARGLRAFRWQLLAAMMGIVIAITAVALYFAERSLVGTAERELQTDFKNQLISLHTVQEIRHVALAERCRTLVRKPRLHAALEDNALDLLYPSAQDELRDVMATPPKATASIFHASFYRFLDRKGAVISAGDFPGAGFLNSAEESQLRLSRAPESQELGYMILSGGGVMEVITMPIFSAETGEVIAALALGFSPWDLRGDSTTSFQSGVLVNGQLYSLSPDAPVDPSLVQQLMVTVTASGSAEQSLRIQSRGVPRLIFYKRLNPGSLFPPAYEVCSYPLDALAARQKRLRWEVIGAGGLLLLCGLVASHILSGRLSVPVEKLAVTSALDRAQRAQAEAALESTHGELQRAARFSADASHQLKTPVTVLRAGLEEILVREHLSQSECEEISALIHQTYRLSSLIEDLLLLSRLDAGHLKLNLAPINLSRLIEASLDDLEASPDDRVIEIKTEFAPDLSIDGEKRYTTIILQNLLENARKYNRKGGHIFVGVKDQGGWTILTVGNTGSSIPQPAQSHIFERFHRGAAGENVPGYGLGLNLAREMARLHGGDLKLLRSNEDWTEFEVRFRSATEGKVA